MDNSLLKIDPVMTWSKIKYQNDCSFHIIMLVKYGYDVKHSTFKGLSSGLARTLKLTSFSNGNRGNVKFSVTP